MNSVTFDSHELNDICKLIISEYTRREAKELADIALDPSSYEDGKLTVKALTKMKSVHELWEKRIDAITIKGVYVCKNVAENTPPLTR